MKKDPTIRSYKCNIVMWISLLGWPGLLQSMTDSNNKKWQKTECLAGPKVKVHPNQTMQTSRPFNMKPRSHMLKTEIQHRQRNGGNMGCARTRLLVCASSTTQLVKRVPCNWLPLSKSLIFVTNTGRLRRDEVNANGD